MTKKVKMVRCYGKFCPKCWRVLFSFDRHHYVPCDCVDGDPNQVMVDGGFDYRRCSVSGEDIAIDIPARILDDAEIEYPENRVGHKEIV